MPGEHYSVSGSRDGESKWSTGMIAYRNRLARRARKREDTLFEQVAGDYARERAAARAERLAASDASAPSANATPPQQEPQEDEMTDVSSWDWEEGF